MSTTATMWRMLKCDWVDNSPDFDMIVVAVQGPGEEVFYVTCSGPKGMVSTGFITALRAATASLLLASGGDLGAVGAETLEDSVFDTGNQKPN